MQLTISKEVGRVSNNIWVLPRCLLGVSDRLSGCIQSDVSLFHTVGRFKISYWTIKLEEDPRTRGLKKLCII